MIDPPAPAERDFERADDDGRGADLLARFVWRRPAAALAGEAERAGLTPVQLLLIAIMLGAAPFFLWRSSWYWTGIAAALAFLLAETVAGEAARSSGGLPRWASFVDQGVGVVYPLLWWWAWAEGLAVVDRPLERVFELMIVGAIVFGHLALRVIKRIFEQRYAMPMRNWKRIDERFDLISAARQPDLAILTLSLLLGRPDVGIELVALWTLLSLTFQAVRLAMANDRRAHGRPVVSWLA